MSFVVAYSRPSASYAAARSSPGSYGTGTVRMYLLPTDGLPLDSNLPLRYSFTIGALLYISTSRSFPSMPGHFHDSHVGHTDHIVSEIFPPRLWKSGCSFTAKYIYPVSPSLMLYNMSR